MKDGHIGVEDLVAWRIVRGFPRDLGFFAFWLRLGLRNRFICDMGVLE